MQSLSHSQGLRQFYHFSLVGYNPQPLSNGFICYLQLSSASTGAVCRNSSSIVLAWPFGPSFVMPMKAILTHNPIFCTSAKPASNRQSKICEPKGLFQGWLGPQLLQWLLGALLAQLRWAGTHRTPWFPFKKAFCPGSSLRQICLVCF